MVDRALGRLYAKLDDLGLRDNTLVIHLSDHGHYIGEHGIQGKPTSGPLQIYEELGRITLMVRHPRRPGRGTAQRRAGPAGGPLRHHPRRRRCPGRRPVRHGIDGARSSLLDGGPGGGRRPPPGGLHQPAPLPAAPPHPGHHHHRRVAYVYWPGGHGARSELYHLPTDARQTRTSSPASASWRTICAGTTWPGCASESPEIADWIAATSRRTTPAAGRGAGLEGTA